MELRPGKDGVISQQMSTTVMSTGRPFTKLIKDSALSFAERGFFRSIGAHFRRCTLGFEVMPDPRPSLSLDMVLERVC